MFTATNYETSPYLSDTQYVADLYYAYLQRAADDGGLGWWAGQVPGSGRANVCNAFEASGEFQTLVANLYGTAASDNERTEHFVNDFYLGAYGRNATSTELQQQRDALNTAAAQGQAQVQTQAETFGRSLFVGQVNDASLSNTQYVTNLYEAFLQRGPDAGGLSWWSGQATLGQGRQNVLNAFATCSAFRELSGTLYREANWLVADHLGTPRMIVGKSGSLGSVKRHDYLPFGEELSAGIGGRTTTQGYSGDSVRQKFTQYERDVETGLDFAKARYYASFQGRFDSVDPVMGSAKPGLPQSWNRYTYTINNPIKYIDPSGLIWGMKKAGNNTSYVWFEGDQVGKGYEVVKEFYVEGIINGQSASLHLNPAGPYSFFKMALMASTAAKFIYSADDYWVKGYEIGETRAQFAERSRTGALDMMRNQAFDVGLTLAGGGLGKLNRSGAGAAIRTPFGTAFQATSPEALAAREAVENGATLYRGGVLGNSAGPEAQFWSLEHPLSPGYAQRYGVPPENTPFNFIEYGKLRPGARFVTTPAAGVGRNAGGAINTVTEANAVKLNGFAQP